MWHYTKKRKKTFLFLIPDSKTYPWCDAPAALLALLLIWVTEKVVSAF